MLPNLGARRWMVVTISIELAMDHKPSHRELASVLISDLYQKVISQRDIGKGMENLNYLVYFSRLFAQIIIIPDFHIVPLFYYPSFLTIHIIDSR